MSATIQPYYLFIRLLEACNANCFMCKFARSKDTYRAERKAVFDLMKQSYNDGVRVVRFTGGEPLIHSDLLNFVADAYKIGLKSSVITNGFKLARIAADLANAGLSQIIISIDGAHPWSHDKFRGTPGLFSRCIEGIDAAKKTDLQVRVNTVVGPHNYDEMLDLQTLLSSHGVDQWELSSLKLEKPLYYTEEQRSDIVGKILPLLYKQSSTTGYLVPLGKMWCGNTPEEQDLYFSTGITPRPDNVCYVVHHVRYYDMKSQMLYPCSLLPHRPLSSEAGERVAADTQFTLHSQKITQIIKIFETNGPSQCTGCSTSAAGFGNNLSSGLKNNVWSY